MSTSDQATMNTKETVMHIRRGARTALLSMALLAALPATAAQAGTYDAWSCRGPQGNAVAIGDAGSGWQIQRSAHTGLINQNHCAAAGYFTAHFNPSYSLPVGAYTFYKFQAPDNTSIRAYDLHWSGFAGGNGNGTHGVGDLQVTRSDLADPTYVERHYGTGNIRDAANPLSDGNRLTQSDLSVSSISLGAACSPGGNANLTCPSGGHAAVRIYRSKVTLQDSSAPTIGSITGEALSEPTLRGQETITLNAGDTGSGVYRLIANVDGNDHSAVVINADGGRCADVDASNANPYEFVHPQPCPLSNSGDVVIDTTGISEGSHVFRLRVEDASGNRTTAYGPVTKSVDNVPPPQVQNDPSTGAPGQPRIVGEARVSSTLVADEGSWSGQGISFAFAWERCDASGAGCAPISGATGETYKLVGDDAGKRVRLVVTATNAEGSTAAASQPTGVVEAASGSGTASPSTASSHSSTSSSTSTREVLTGANGIGASSLAKITAVYGSQKVVRARYGKRVAITGRVLNEHGSPVTGAVVDVIERPRGRNELTKVGTVVTGSDGSFSYLLPVGTSRMVRFAYRFRAGDTEYAHTTDVEVLVKAVVGFKATTKVKGRQPLRFRGNVGGARRGAFVLLQAKVGRKWQIFEKAKLSSKGTFKASYVFRRTRVATTFQFRALYAGKDGSNLDPAQSRVVKVRYRP